MYFSTIRQGKNIPKLISTISGIEYPLERIEEFADNGESLEVLIPDIESARIDSGENLWQRYLDFLPFNKVKPDLHLGEGNTPLIRADRRLQEFTGIKDLFLKNETQNPTWSFKDRGSLACIYMAREMKENVTATISSGNMGNSIAAYGAKAGIKVIVFVPEFVPKEKIFSMFIHDAKIIRVKADDYSKMKKHILGFAKKLKLRIVSGNGPIRVEGYKLTAFEMFEQMKKRVPDYIAVPTSACGHIRGIFKGYWELQKAGFIDKLPRMIIVQAENNSPIVSAIKQGKDQIIPFSNFHTIAEAITTGNPMGGRELIHKAKKYHWLAESVTEEEILQSQRKFGEVGYFVEPASATSLYAVKKLRKAGKIEKDATVVLMLTGTGLKDLDIFQNYRVDVMESDIENIEEDIKK
ncbi:MAG: threonine synthase [Candidatus Caldatribacteriota bacterium]|nr:threonine synthase [Candidatus Caldatribacteriota bacterium]